MPIEKVVINASPLILLVNSGFSFLLPEMFQEIIVPDAVWDEIMNCSHLDKAFQLLPKLNWTKKACVKIVPQVVQWDLGSGETEVLSFALCNSDYVAVLDDRAAKKCSLALGIRTIGTGSLLILAKQKKILDSVEKALMALRDSGMWISDDVVKLLKQKAGE